MDENNSYGQILKSSSIMGGVAGVNMILGMIRTKFSALLIGVVGTGLLSGFMSIQGLVSTFAGLGMQSSVVREVAFLHSSGDSLAMGRAIVSLKRVCLLTGMVGLIFVALFSPLISRMTFGSSDYQIEVAFLGLIVLFNNIAGGQLALMQGLRKIEAIAKANLIGAVFSTFVSIGLYFWLGKDGIVPSLVAISVIQLFVAWYFGSKLTYPSSKLNWRETFTASEAMIKLGLVFMWNALMTSAVSYATISLIVNKLELRAVGIYSAAFALSGMFVNFVLSAMGTDYYPSLASNVGKPAKMNSQINEQTEIGMLLALPGLIFTMALAPWIIRVFYSVDFLPSTDILRWFILGCYGRIISWPLGFLILALGNKRQLLLVETFFNLMHLFLIYLGIEILGLLGVSVAFLIVNVIYAFTVYIVGSRQTNFSWSARTWRLFIYSAGILMLNFLISLMFPLNIATVSGLVFTIVTGIYSARWIISELGEQHRISRIISRIPVIRAILR